MKDNIKTLLLPYSEGIIAEPTEDSKLLFLNAEDKTIIPKNISCELIQPLYNKATTFKNSKPNYNGNDKFDTIWILPSKNITETKYLLAQAVLSTKEDGIIIAAASNDAGGKRLDKLFKELGLTPNPISKYKSRVVFSKVKEEINKTRADIWIKEGSEQKILNSDILSIPGIYGWDKIDEGSKLLARHIPEDLTGDIADFGCGWGYLSLSTIEKSQNIKSLTLIDIDYRSISIAEKNIKNKSPNLKVDKIWTDLTEQNKDFGKYDTILMNPPFHEGKKADPTIGQNIIKSAAKSLKPKGNAYIVANIHLPYEEILKSNFKKVTIIDQSNKFKLFHCLV